MRKQVNNWSLYFSKRKNKWDVSHRQWDGEKVISVKYKEFETYDEAEEWAKQHVPVAQLIQNYCVIS